MSRRDIESGGTYGPLNGADDTDDDTSTLRPSASSTNGATTSTGPTRSIYTLSRPEIARGLANRLVHSRAYALLYLGMASASAATVLLSLMTKRGQCPPLSFYILEIVVNTAMVAEVAVRLVAFGARFWTSALNIFDVLVTLGCAVTLVVLFFAQCGAGSRGEEILDTLLLVVRNVLQFIRLAGVLRQSGHSLFSRPRPIDLSASAARRAGLSLDADFAEEYDLVSDDGRDELGRPLVPPPPPAIPSRTGASDMPRAAQAVANRDEEDMWAELG